MGQEQSMKQILFLFSFLVLPLILSGCGAPSGTGLDAPVAATTKNVVVQELLAVDDKLVGSTIQVSTALAQNGHLSSPLQINQILTGNDGKTNSFNLSVGKDVSTLYFQASGGTNGPGGTALSSNTYFTGVLELADSNESEVANRVNINPFTSIIAYAKSKSPETKVGAIAAQAVNAVFAQTSISSIDINSAQYQGNSTAVVETEGDGTLFQLMNEMIKLASRSTPGANLAEQVSNFTTKALSDVSQTQGLFSTSGGILQGLSTVSGALSTNTSVFGSFFSSALTVLSTSTSASIKPSGFRTAQAGLDVLTLGSLVSLDSVTAVLHSVSSGVALVANSDGSSLVLTSLPSRIRFDLSQNQYKLLQESSMVVDLVRSSTDQIKAEVNRVLLDSRANFKLTIPVGALIQGLRIQSSGTVQLGTVNQSADEFASPAGFLEIPVQELIAKAEVATGQSFSTISGETLNLKIQFPTGVDFQITGQTQRFQAFALNGIQIQ